MTHIQLPLYDHGLIYLLKYLSAMKRRLIDIYGTITEGETKPSNDKNCLNKRNINYDYSNSNWLRYICNEIDHQTYVLFVITVSSVNQLVYETFSC